MFWNQYPYLNINDLNLDFILKAIGEIQNEVTNFVSINAIKYADPIQWDITRQYEKNTIVIDPVTGTAYISVQAVPSGVALTRTEYWSVVFDLEQFVTKASENFTNRVEEQTTLTATFPTNENEWLVWGGELYKANANIIAGDQYVVNSNITRITIEEITGHPEELDTLVKTNLVAAINELFADITTLFTNLGDLNNLTTSDKTSIVNAINELVTNIGDLNNLTTSDISSIVNAINEVVANVGDLNNLTTVDTSSIVAAINEVKSMIHEVQLIGTDVMRIYVDSLNGDDNNDGLSIATAVKTLDYALTFAGSTRISNATSTGLNIYFVNPDTYVTTKSYFSGGELHLYNSAGGAVHVIVRPDGGIVKFYSFYLHLLGTVNEDIEITFDCNTLTFDNSGTWYNHAIVNTTNNTIFQQFSGGCRVVDSTIRCQYQIDGQLITNNATFEQRLYINTGNWLMYGDTTIAYLTARNSFISLNNHKLTISAAQTRPIYMVNCTFTGLANSPIDVEEPDAAGINEIIAAYDCVILFYSAITTTISNKFNRLLFAQRCVISAKTLLDSYATVANNKIAATECINYEDIADLDARVTALGG